VPIRPGKNVITVTASDAAGDTGSATITLTNTIPTLSISPAGGIVASGYVGGPFSPASVTYTLQNPGSSSLKWTAGKTKTWLTLSSTGGTLAAGGSTTVIASFGSGANSLTVGSYSDTISFTNTTNGNGNTTLGVSLTVNASMSVFPTGGLISSGYAGGLFTPNGTTYTVQNLGSATLKWTAGKKQSWTTLSPTSGLISSGKSATVTVSFNSGAKSLPPGNYSDTISFTNSTNGSGNAIRTLSLTVNPALSVSSTAGLVSSGYAGGAFAPSTVTYTLSNLGNSSLKWTASKKQTWITLSSSSGSILPNGSTTVTVSINSSANTLATGSYSDTVSFASPSGGNTTRSVGLTISPALSVSPSGEVTSSGYVGGPFTPSSVTYTLQNMGNSPLKWTASKKQTWITLSSASGTIAGGKSATVTVSFNSAANDLAVGGYSDLINFTDSTNPKVTTSRGITLSITAP
jgi:hypothetical protein